MNPLLILETVIATAPKVGIAIELVTALYRQLQGIFGSDVLPDKTDADIAALAADDFVALKARIAAAKAALEAPTDPPADPSEPPAEPQPEG